MAPYYIPLRELIIVSICVGLFALYHIIMEIRKGLKRRREYMRLPRHEAHLHYWIEDETLVESYATSRGIRYTALMKVPGFPDTEICNDECITKIEEQCQTSTK